MWGTSRSGATNITVKNGATLDTDTVSGASTYTDAEGICVAGSGPGFGGQRSFPGTQLYWGWGAALTATELGHVESAFVNSQLPPDTDSITGALLIDDDGNYFAVDDEHYIKVDGS